MRFVRVGLTWLGLAALLVCFPVVGVTDVHDNGLFELDGNAYDDDGDGELPDDWQNIYDSVSTGTKLDSAYARVFVGLGGEEVDGIDTSYFDGGGSKDVRDLSDWRHSPNDVAPDKDEITHAFAAAYVNGGGQLLLYFGADRLANNGDAQIGFWFFQQEVTLNPDGTFEGVHEDGDILVLSDFTQGGAISTIKVYAWRGVRDLELLGEGSDCLDPGPGAVEDVCALVNTETEPSPWPYQPKSGDAGFFPFGSLYEGGVNLAALGVEPGCFSSFLAETRSSQSVTAQLKDFALGQFNVCKIEVDKNGDELSKVGDDVTYDFSICNEGALPLYLQSAVDVGDGWPGLGDMTALAAAGGCDFLLPGECCHFSDDYTVQPGDPDPLNNTVTVVYNSRSDLSGDEVTNSDSHSVELFQPGVAIEVTGDELSKVTDPVNYTITVTNTSSEDSPPLVGGQITSSVLGDLLSPLNPFVTSSTCSDTLPVGASCTIQAMYIVQPGDPDPLQNTVQVLFNPEGFPNEIADSDAALTNLFQPDVQVVKTGDELSKVGDDVNYTITVTNTSSIDSPPLVNAQITDDLLGDLLAPGNSYVTGSTCGSTLEVGASCTINARRTVEESDPDPLENTVTVLYNPEGFPNEITDSDSHSVELFQPSVEVVKTGDGLSKVGDPVNYVITVTNTSSADSPPLVNAEITDTLLGNLLDGANPYVTSSTCGGTLGVGASCTIEATRVVQPGDADPLVNTVTVHYNPDGFPNDITDSDSHTVELFQPSVEVVKTGDELSKVGDPVEYVITVTNTSSSDSPPLVNADITDTLLGDLLDGANPYVTSNGCAGPLAPGASCTILAARTVEAGDPDPLENTVTVHFNPQGFPNDIHDSDSHTVNLFQPSFTVTKTGDELSKIGDPVSYTIEICNTSSPDSPNLVKESVTDSLIADMDAAFGASLAPGECESHDFTREVQEGDPDPLVNEVVATYGVEGFPNILTERDTHSVNLFQPSVEVVKTGDELSKIGDEVNYLITVTNTSSDDSPPLVNAEITDTLLGNLLDGGNSYVKSSTCGATLAVGASCTIEATRIVEEGDPDPLENTVTVHYNPEGFPNDISDSDSHTVNLFQPSLTVTKTGDELSKIGDVVTYTITVCNTSSADSPDLVKQSVTDSLIGGVDSAFGPSIAPGGCETHEFTREVQPDDPDPLVNEVVATYGVEGFSNILTERDTHTVNLFQPGVAIEVTGDELSKVTDPVNYVITVTNTSSADSPPLVGGQITSSLLGDLLNAANPFVTSSGCSGTLAVGASCTIEATRVVQEDDPDPLPNTVTAVFSPEGFPNEIADSDVVVTNLFQPSVQVVKTGDALSKIGDPVDYVITVTNTSSSDSPPLVGGQITDTLLGNLLDGGNPYVTSSTCGATLAVGASCTIQATRVVQDGDPDPLENTVTVLYNPEGFPNEISDSDSHTVNLFQPGVAIEVTGDELSKVTDPVNYVITVTNTSSSDSPPLVGGQITDTLLGDLLDGSNVFVTSSTCGTTLGVGASCTIEAMRVVQPGDPDPLENTVTVHYNPEGFPNDISDSDSHTVELFQPSVEVEKTGDELSKIGDPVEYVITVTNTSSADSPPLVNPRITDTLLGDLLDPANPYVTGKTCGSTLEVGASCTITATRTVQEGDPDPLVNTVSVLYNPEGFPNEITDSDSHSVELFQPSVEVVKTGDGLSKVGDPVNYVITVTNTSSADSPPLVNAEITDTLLGNLLDGANPYVTSSTCGGTLGVGASCTIEAMRVVQPGDADPLVNTVTVHYNPDGFPNDISDSDSHTVNLFQPSVAVDVTGDDLSKAGDAVNYVFTITNTSSADSPPLMSPQITDSLLGDLLAANPFVTSNTCVAALSPGAACEIQATRVVEPGDPDPLVNTVTVVYNPQGFPNEIQDTDLHTVDLVHPDYTVTKDCSPSEARPGDTITYTIVVANTGDVGLDPVSCVDSLVGTVVCPPSIGVGQSETITYTRVIQSGDSDPLVNEITTVYQVQGLSNQLTRTASCEVDIVGCALSPGFWGGGEGKPKWDEPTDMLGGALVPFTTETVFPHLDPSRAGSTYFEVLKLSTGGDVTIQLAFKYIAARLNQVTFGVPESTATTLDEVEVYFTSNPVGSNPEGSAQEDGKALKQALDSYFATVGEEFCPDPDSF